MSLVRIRAAVVQSRRLSAAGSGFVPPEIGPADLEVLCDLADAARHLLRGVHDAPGGGMAASADLFDDLLKALTRLDGEDSP